MKTMDRQSVPLLRGFDMDASFAFERGRSIRVREWLADVQTLARALPACRYVLNYCEDRYRFSVAFAATLVRGATNVLPPSRAPHALRRLGERYDGLVVVADPGEKIDGLTTVAFPVLGGGSDATDVIPHIDAAHVAAVLFTSGSTGEPTPHAKPWGPLAHGAGGEALHLELPSRASLLATVPPQHMYGLESSVILAWQNGFTFHAGRPFYPQDIRVALEELRPPRVLVTTPLHLRALIAEAATLAPLPAIARLVSATAPLDAGLAAQAEAVLGAPVFEIYGCTETGMVASRRTMRGPMWRALPGVRIRAEGERYLASGGHVPAEAPLADMLEVADAEHFELRGRLSDVVNVAGKRASLAHLTSVLQSVPGVRDAAYFLPEEEATGVQRLCALVVAPTLTRADVLRVLRERIDPAFLPRPLYLVDALPRNTTGKLPREALLQAVARLDDKDSHAARAP